MTSNRLLSATLALSMLVTPAFAQGYGGNQGYNQNSRSSPFNGQDSVAQPNQTYPGNQGFSFQGDQLAPSYDTRRPNNNDLRYSQTYQQHQQEAQQRPGGGCLKYGAVGAAGGHLAHHGILGALVGCATGTYIRHRDKERIRAEENGRD